LGAVATYRNPTAVAGRQRLFTMMATLFAFAAALGGFRAIRGDATTLGVVASVVIGAGAVLAAALALRAGTVRVETSEHGIKVVNLLGGATVPWERAERVEPGAADGSKGTSGARLIVTQGRAIILQATGEQSRAARTIVKRLNAEIAAAHAGDWSSSG
jgi:hypothetical protein